MLLFERILDPYNEYLELEYRHVHEPYNYSISIIV